jgi:hypothetical protein
MGKKRKKIGIGRREEYTPFINQSEDRIQIKSEANRKEHRKLVIKIS